MEELRVLEFISCDCGNGAGCGSGYGFSYCDGSGSGSGDSVGYCDGTGYGEGCGSGYGSRMDYGYSRGHGCGISFDRNLGSGSGFGSFYGGILNYNNSLNSINGKQVYIVGGIPTTISHIHRNTAKGTIVNSDLTETPCYIVKEGRYFAHGKTLAEANTTLQSKLFNDMPIEERIAAFWKCHKRALNIPPKIFSDGITS